ncbi:neurogenic locus Notch protein [Biomphalaria pfeifferi]|uniref:Neurogenic locus Notch protein n=1 Tax=Biomphalaria pfeifferi TaxID=112525 RepID=A0AAD8C6Q7_BIOPF|nr:neurogenic locus Notch protein [Biomphalaria pfeifferi]
MMHIVKMTNQGFENMATLNYPDETNTTSVQTHTRHDTEVTYFRHQNSFTLSVLLLKPSSLDAGTYMCRVIGNNALRSSFQVNESLNVTLKEDCSLDQMYFGPKTYNNSQYYLSKFIVLNVKAAISKCGSLGGYLMEVNNEAEWNLAHELAVNTTVDRAYIAGSDESKENLWIYPRTKLNMTFTKWMSGQPDNHTHWNDKRLHFQSTPNVIIIGATKEVSFACSWRGLGSFSIRRVHSIQLMKETNQGFKSMATLKHPDDMNTTSVQTHNESDIDVTYWKHQNCLTLSVLLAKPSAGTYICRVDGVNAMGSSIQVNESLKVTRKEDCSIDQMYFGPTIHNNTKYYLSKFGALDAEDADSRCKSLGGYLMEVDDEEEFEIASNLANDTDVDKAYIAGSDSQTEGTWIYPRTGKKMTFLKFSAGNFESITIVEDCLEIAFKFESGIHDVTCDSDNAYFCEVKVFSYY